MKKLFLSIFATFLGGYLLQGQSLITLERELVWSDKSTQVTTASGEAITVWNFENSSLSDKYRSLPVYNERIALGAKSTVVAEMVSAEYEPFEQFTSMDESLISEEVTVQTSVEVERNKYFGRLKLMPIRKTGNQYERLKRFVIKVKTTAAPVEVSERGPNTFTSVLSDGSIYKFGVQKHGVYKLDYDYLKNTLKIGNLDQVNPKKIQIFGNAGGMLPERVGAARIDDLAEVAVQVVGGNDGVFNNGDYILLYAQGIGSLDTLLEGGETRLSFTTNLYDTHNYYFLKIGNIDGLRIGTQENMLNTAATSEAFDEVRRYEPENFNLLDFFSGSTGSGKRWYGDYFKETRSKNYSNQFVINNAVVGEEANVNAIFAGRSTVASTFKLSVNGTLFSKNISSVNVGNIEDTFARDAVVSGTAPITGDNISVLLDYPAVSGQSEGWLDYIELQVRRQLKMVTGEVLQFTDLRSRSHATTTFTISNSTDNTVVWDVTSPYTPQQQIGVFNSNKFSFGAATAGVIKRFAAFEGNGNLPKPEKSIGSIPTQNLHQYSDLDMAIVYHPDFEVATQRLAEHRKTFSGLKVAALKVDELYNEFSSGKKDIGAIRDFAKMVYDRNPNFKYLLLLGDGTFDPRNISNVEDNKDFVPVFETLRSDHSIYSHPSDDFFGLMDEFEDGSLNGALDLSVGRLTVNSAQEAEIVVNKIITYDKDPAALGDWHNKMLFIGDDEDNNAHIAQADFLAKNTLERNPFFNIEKIYLDAYQQEATSAGARYPTAKQSINATVFQGTLILNYIGHGGPKGWTQERVTDNNDIAQWDNQNRCHLVVSATCSFGGYDNFRFLSGGEQVLLKPLSGAIGLFTTVRAVYISGNNQLTKAVDNVIFQKENGYYNTIGDILRKAKNQLSGGDEDNARRFTLLGDPAMYLALPEYKVATLTINDIPIASGQLDTLSALEQVKIAGQVQDTLGNHLSGFNGRVFVTVYDKEQNLRTLGQDAGSPIFNFKLQRNIIFKGSATVTNGNFTIQFVVPKDINYSFGQGKISYYAENGTPLDAAGHENNFIIGGISNSIQDDKAPIVQVYMNTESFVSGGGTNPSPKLLAVVSDDYGINISGTSIGHDMTAILDDNVQEAIVLNSFFESNQDNYKAGKALYPLRNLAPGKHTISVKAWDVANNSGVGQTEFIVADDAQTSLDHVLNYPNPFTTSTNFTFEHNLAGQLLDVQVRVFTVSGKLVKTIQQQVTSSGPRVENIAWDGRDEYGDQIGKGVYIYKVKVKSGDSGGGSVVAESGYEKLVILK